MEMRADRSYLWEIMRIRANVAALSGALALSALAVPAAYADMSGGSTEISSVVVNGGKTIVIGTTAKTITATVMGTDPDGIGAGAVNLWHGATYINQDGSLSGTPVNGIPDGAVDAWRFEQALRRATTFTDPSEAVTVLDGGLSLWRGPAFAEHLDPATR
jgi:hypothetical protein